MIDLRAFAFIDQLQKQMVAYIGSASRGYYPVTGQAALFLEIAPGVDGLVHISEMADCRVNSVDDICKVGDPMTVKCIGIDDRGRIKLSRRAAMQDKDQA